MRNLPPLNALLHFCVAARHQSFSRAAEELNLTHGAVSRSVKQLEGYFGFRLFERRNRRVYLNEAGQEFYRSASRTLESFGEASEQLKLQRSPKSISVSCEPTLAMRWLMPRLGGLEELLTGQDIQLSTAGGPINLIAQNIDVAIRRSDFNWPNDYWVSELGSEWIGPVCRPGYLKNLGKDLPTGLHTRTRTEAWSSWVKQSGQKTEFGSERYFDHFYFSLQAATAGLGMAMGSAQMVHDDIMTQILQAPFGFVKTPVKYVALTAKSPESDPRLRRFLSWLETIFEGTQPLHPQQVSGKAR